MMLPCVHQLDKKAHIPKDQIGLPVMRLYYTVKKGKTSSVKELSWFVAWAREETNNLQYVSLILEERPIAFQHIHSILAIKDGVP